MKHIFHKKLFITTSLCLLIIIGLIGLLNKPNYQTTFKSQASVQAQASSTEWPQLQKDAGHSGYTVDTYGAPFTQKWKIDETSNPKAPPVSARVQPVIAYSLVYLPSNDQNLYAYNTANGTRAWSYATNGPLVASAGVDVSNQTVIFGSQDGYIYGLNAVTGTYKWKFDTGARIRVAPVIITGLVYIGNNKGTVYCLNTANGTVVWSKTLDSAILDTPAYDAGQLYVGTYGTKAYAINGSTGAVIWQKQLQGQGMRDRWIVAGNGYVFFNPIPINRDIGAGTKVITDNYSQPWSVQRQAILNFQSTDQNHRATYIFSSTGTEIIPPIFYADAGSFSEYVQPVILPNGNFNLLFRYSEGRPNPGCDGTCNFWSQYLGEYSSVTNDITRLDTWGSTTSDYNVSKKIPFITDESCGLSRSGAIIYIDCSRGTMGFDTRTNTVIPFSSYNISSGGVYYNPDIKFYPFISGNGWVTQYPGAEMDSDGNDYKRPSPIANGVFYLLHNSVLIAAQAIKQ